MTVTNAQRCTDGCFAENFTQVPDSLRTVGPKLETL